MRRQHPRTRTAVQHPVNFTIESLSHEGRGIAHYGAAHSFATDKVGKKVFVAFALAGETVRAVVQKQHKKYEEAQCIQVIDNPSPVRVAPMCVHFGVCGGCSLQHMQVDAQLDVKQAVLQSHLTHFAQLTPDEWLAPLRATRTDYRRKARLGVRWLPKQKKIVLGFRERNSPQLTPLTMCSVLDALVSAHLPALHTLLMALAGRDDITHLEMAVGDDAVALVVRHTKPLVEADIARLLHFAAPLQWQVYLQPDAAYSLHRIDLPNAPMRLHYELAEFNLKISFSPLDFTQINQDINQSMVRLACDLLQLSAGEHVLDLFCGLGNFSLPLARCVGSTGRVVAVEGSAEMVRRGDENAALNDISHIEFYAQDLTKDFTQQVWAKQGFDAIVIDPPRAGAEEVMHYLPKFKAKRIVYVSCNPATLARDAGILSKAGYRMTKVGVMDMFTHTDHVESIALFELSSG